eukprot:200088-Hanusia_phi.AAC.2
MMERGLTCFPVVKVALNERRGKTSNENNAEGEIEEEKPAEKRAEEGASSSLNRYADEETLQETLQKTPESNAKKRKSVSSDSSRDKKAQKTSQQGEGDTKIVSPGEDDPKKKKKKKKSERMEQVQTGIALEAGNPPDSEHCPLLTETREIRETTFVAQDFALAPIGQEKDQAWSNVKSNQVLAKSKADKSVEQNEARALQSEFDLHEPSQTRLETGTDSGKEGERCKHDVREESSFKVHKAVAAQREGKKKARKTEEKEKEEMKKGAMKDREALADNEGQQEADKGPIAEESLKEDQMLDTHKLENEEEKRDVKKHQGMEMIEEQKDERGADYCASLRESSEFLLQEEKNRILVRDVRVVRQKLHPSRPTSSSPFWLKPFVRLGAWHEGCEEEEAGKVGCGVHTRAGTRWLPTVGRCGRKRIIRKGNALPVKCRGMTELLQEQTGRRRQRRNRISTSRRRDELSTDSRPME